MEVRVLIKSHRSRALAAALVAALAGLVASVPLAQARATGPLTLNVNFFTTGNITLSLPDGTPVGVTSGSPTTIPAGYYQVVELGPGGCSAMPHFSLKGPGVTLFDNLNEGESATVTTFVTFAPNATYTWSNDASPNVVHTFQTSSDVVGTAPPKAPNGLTASGHTTVSSSSLVGSAIVPFRGTITGSVSLTGKLTLSFGGKSVSSLTAGRYKFSVTDKSRSRGFLLQKNSSGMVTVTGVSFVGKHADTVRLTKGNWTVLTRPGAKAAAVVVS
ncbi:MAG TPA: hypothetical protein VGL76_05620 [Gaiellaceae bacterium]